MRRRATPHHQGRPSLLLRPSAETTAQLSWSQGTDFISRSTPTLLLPTEAQQSISQYPAYVAEDHRLTQPTRDLGRTSVQTPAQSRLSYGPRPNRLGLFILLRLAVLKGWQWYSLSGPLLRCWAVFMGKGLLLIVRLSISIASCPPAVCCSEEQLSLLGNLLINSSGQKGTAETGLLHGGHKQGAPTTGVVHSGVRLVTVTSPICSSR